MSTPVMVTSLASLQSGDGAVLDKGFLSFRVKLSKVLGRAVQVDRHVDVNGQFGLVLGL
jgi:hypothetical protein